MSVRPRTAVAFVAAITVFGAAGAALAATTVNPPAGTPNLAQMALAPADLASSDGVAGSGYITPPQRFNAAYAATLFPSVTSDGVKYASVTSEVAVAPAVSDATGQLASEYSHYYSAGGRRRFVREIVKASPKHGPGHLTAKNFAYSGVGPAGIGDGSYIETLTLREHHRSQQQVYLVYVTGTYYIYVNLAGTVERGRAAERRRRARPHGRGTHRDRTRRQRDDRRKRNHRDELARGRLAARSIPHCFAP